MKITFNRITTFLSITLLLACSACANVKSNDKAIKQVESGELTTANAAWWGFDKKDSTKALQAAIDSGAKKVLVPNMNAPWVVNTTIQLASNQTIVFEKGVVILAKKGKFHDKFAFLFEATNKHDITLRGYGATWKMRKADYDSGAYTHSEWRHALALFGCKDIEISGLRIESSGGDGIYIGRSGSYGTKKSSQPPYYCQNITIHDVVLNDNYRQGVSVISVDGLLMENVVMSNTGGTKPMAGIDFEPNGASQRLSNIVLKNCIVKNNRGSGFELHLNKLNQKSEPVSIKFINCQAINNRSAPVSISTAAAQQGAPRGSVTFENCTFTHKGIRISNKPASALKVTFKNCSIAKLADNVIHPILFSASSEVDYPVGGATFDNVHIYDSKNRQPIGYTVRTLNAPLKDVSGTLVLTNKNGSKTVKLTKAVLNKWVPLKFEKVPYVDLSKVDWSENNKQADKLYNVGKAHIRGRPSPVEFGIYASKGDEVKVKVRFGQVVNRRGSAMPTKITAPSGKQVYEGKLPFKKVTQVEFSATETGLYLLSAKPGGNYVKIEQSTNPIGVVTPEAGFDLFNSKGTYYFWVPKGTKQFALRVSGFGSEGFRAILKGPSGNTIKDIDNVLGLRQITLAPKPNQTGKIWSIHAGPASIATFEDHTFILFGIPPLVSMTKQTVIKSK